tara:strand:+ start:708 stop:851 length:144 start_codon:yes stop_codon:yes gene_type:complete
MKYEFAIVEKLSTGILIGFSFYPKLEDKDFNELNIYCILFVLHFKIY